METHICCYDFMNNVLKLITNFSKIVSNLFVKEDEYIIIFIKSIILIITFIMHNILNKCIFGEHISHHRGDESLNTTKQNIDVLYESFNGLLQTQASRF